MQTGIERVGSQASKYRADSKTIDELTSENEKLKKQNENLTSKLSQIQLQSSELENLQKLYKLDQQYTGYNKTGARIIARGSDNWFNTFTIDKGTKDGIRTDMNVIADGGLVGIVIKSGRNYSVVRSIIDDTSNVSGMSLNTGNTCIISGNLQSMTKNNRIKITNLENPDKKIKSGEPIVTSNISDKYLPGILIGYLDNTKEDSNQMTFSGTVTPAVDFKHLQNVLVVLSKKETGAE
ncbi:MAG: rod shape-determining protein MreC [Lachnospiraceae bacterium]|nr:rod shape-determining protein MreC [Lachnospiraceae bacterium]